MRQYLRSLIAFSIVGLSCWTPLHGEEARGDTAMIVTAHPIASQFGMEILRSGGNAIDAAVGAAVVLGVVEPHASGFGGGGAMLIYLADRDSLTYINYYARAPRFLPTDFDSETEARTGQAVLVPGTVAGLSHALASYGTFTWRDILTMALAKVENGFQVDAILFKIMLDDYVTLTMYPQTGQIYLRDGFPIEEGGTIRNDFILPTLRKLAQGGADIFYRGEIADSIVTAVTRHGGDLRKSDLEAYRPIELSPVLGSYRGYEVVSAPPPQSGAVLIEILNILEFKDLSAMGSYSENVATFHFMAETMKRAYADRMKYLSDPAFMTVPVEALTSKEFAKSRYKTINRKKAVPSDPRKTPAGDVSRYLDSGKDKDGSTTHISVVDGAGNAVSLTQTNNRFWGSGISVGGFILNNGMTGFSRTGSANSIRSGRQPRSTIVPTMLFKDGELAIVIGSPGGWRIISTMAEVICNTIDFGQSPDEANRAPRFASRKYYDTLPVEDSFDPDMLENLRILGHPIEILGEMDVFFGGVQLIVVDHDSKSLIGSSDPRRSGAPRGF
jgi:gamma-glutamyltranspeptidase/glutathione hydrolase